MYKSIVNIQKAFNKFNNIKMSLETACPIIANQTKADRILIYKEEIDDKGRHSFLKKFHQWNDKGTNHIIASNEDFNPNMISISLNFEVFSTTLAIGKPFIYTRNIDSSEMGPRLKKHFDLSDAHTVVGLPIIINKELWGVFASHYITTDIEIDTELIALLTVVTNILSSAISSENVKNMNSNILVDDQSIKMAEVGRMAAGIAHEINNPVFIIGGFTSRMEQILDDPLCFEKKDEAFSCLDIIKKNCKKITGIIEGLRMMSRDSSKDDYEVIDINEVARIIYDISKDRFQLESIAFTLESKTSESLVECRPGQVSQVLTNLLNNSFDSISKSTESKWIKIEMKTSDDNLILSVIDSGPRLSEELMANIMEPFFTTKSRGNGTGLGLSISREIIKRFNGKLSIDKSFETVKFDIILPLISFDEEE